MKLFLISRVYFLCVEIRQGFCNVVAGKDGQESSRASKNIRDYNGTIQKLRGSLIETRLMLKNSSYFSLVLLVALTQQAAADVDLVTIPRRESTQLTIYNSEDITMVREHRLLTLKNGINRIQFSWANTLIDPTSIDFRILDHIDKVDLVDTTFPSGRNDALQWNINSQIDGKVPVELEPPAGRARNTKNSLT